MKKSMSDFEYDGGYYEEIGDFLRENYLNYVFTKGTVKEVEFLVELMDLPPKARLLDIGCGPGRHSLELARRGFRPTGIDISSEFINCAKQAAAEEQLDARFLVRDARELDLSPAEFDGAICLCEGAFGLAGSEENHRKVLRGVRKALKPGTLFVLTALNALHMARNITEESDFNAYSCTVIDYETIVSPKGETKEVPLYSTAFTYRELKILLESEGFEVQAAYGCIAGHFGRDPLKVDSMEIMMVARKI